MDQKLSPTLQPKRRRQAMQVSNYKFENDKLEQFSLRQQISDQINELENTVHNQQELIHQGINMLVYGVFLKKLTKRNQKCKQRYFFISDEDMNYLHYFSKQKLLHKTRINLKKVREISLDGSKMNKSQYPFIITIIFESSNKLFTFIMDHILDQLMIYYAIRYLIIQVQSINESIIEPKNQIHQLNEYLNRLGPKNFQSFTSEDLQYFSNLFKFDGKSIKDEDLEDDFLKSKNELIDLFRNYSKFDKLEESVQTIDEFQMTYDDLKFFYRNEQLQELESFDSLVCKSNQSQRQEINQAEQLQKINFQQFSEMLQHHSNSIFNPKYAQIYQNMNFPITDYYISSSHNTYLEGNQFQGTSSAEAYINAFKKGCRCIEIDCWDGNQEPMVYHGYTLTSKITFRKVIKTLAQYAFRYSEYPLIVSLEIHCSNEQQKQMAEIIQEELWEDHLGQRRFMVYTLPCNYDQIQTLPCPEELKRFILLKGKGSLIEQNHEVSTVSRAYLTQWRSTVMDIWKQKSQLRSLESDLEVQLKYQNLLEKLEKLEKQEQQENQVKEFNQHRDIDKISSKQSYIQKKRRSRSEDLWNLQIDTDDVEKQNQNFEHENKETAYKLKKIKTRRENGNIKIKHGMKLHEGLNSLICLINTPFDIVTSNRQLWQISSLDEHKIVKLSNQYPDEIKKFHKSFFSRIYPSGQRISSSNYGPLHSFIYGSQIVALNFQTMDLPLFTLLSKFQENGGIECGYLLKPIYLRKEFSQQIMEIDHSKIHLKIGIQILSGLNFQREAEGNGRLDINSQVQVYLKGSQLDDKENQIFKTNVIHKNGSNPQFQSKVFQFNVYNPDNALIIFEVFSSDCSFRKKHKQGWYGIPVNCIRQGYRIVPLRNTKFEIIESSQLLVKVVIDKISD